MRMTCMLRGLSFGEKRTPFLVLKVRASKLLEIQNANVRQRHEFGKKIWKKATLPAQKTHDVHIYGNESGWWNEGLPIIWLNNSCKRRKDPSIPILLLLDDFTGHWTRAVIAHATSPYVQLLKAPSGYIGVCQPALRGIAPSKFVCNDSWLPGWRPRSTQLISTIVAANLLP